MSEWLLVIRAHAGPSAQDKEQTAGSDSNYWPSDQVNDLCIPCLTAQGSEQAQRASTELKQAVVILLTG